MARDFRHKGWNRLFGIVGIGYAATVSMLDFCLHGDKRLNKYFHHTGGYAILYILKCYYTY